MDTETTKKVKGPEGSDRDCTGYQEASWQEGEDGSSSREEHVSRHTQACNSWTCRRGSGEELGEWEARTQQGPHRPELRAERGANGGRGGAITAGCVKTGLAVAQTTGWTGKEGKQESQGPRGA